MDVCLQLDREKRDAMQHLRYKNQQVQGNEENHLYLLVVHISSDFPACEHWKARQRWTAMESRYDRSCDLCGVARLLREANEEHLKVEQRPSEQVDGLKHPAFLTKGLHHLATGI